VERRLVLVHAVERLAEADVGGRRDRHVVHADDPLVQPRGVAELGVLDEARRMVERDERRLPRERAL
jgi:hypothetical protein